MSHVARPASHLVTGCILLMLLVILLAAPASASHILGIKVTVTNADAGTQTADIDVTQYAESSSPDTTTTIDYDSNDGGGAYYPISWGEGEVSSPITLELVAASNPTAWRGSFSHTYSSAGPFTIRVSSDTDADESSSNWVTGNPIYDPTESTEVNFFTNTASVDFAAFTVGIPTLGTWGVLLLSVMLMGGSLFILRR